MEQITAPNKRDVKSVTGRQLDDASAALHPTEYKIAKTIYDAKGVVYDDENAAIKAIQSIKNSTQWNLVDKFLKKLTKGIGIASYVVSQGFIDSPADLQKILKHAKTVNADAKSINTLNIYRKPPEFNWGNIDISGGTGGMGSPIAAQALTDPEYRHQYLTLMGFATMFIPMVGPFVSSAIMAGDAALYWSEGDRYTGGLMAIFATLPLIGPIGKVITKIPGIGPVTVKMMAKIGQKIAAAKENVNLLAKTLNPKEWKIVKKLIENKNLVKSELTKYFQRLARKVPANIKGVGKKGAAVIRQIGNGTVSITKALARLAKFGVKTFGPFYAIDNAWDKLYFDLGLDKALGGDDSFEFGVVDAGLNQTGNQGRYVYK